MNVQEWWDGGGREIAQSTKPDRDWTVMTVADGYPALTASEQVRLRSTMGLLANYFFDKDPLRGGKTNVKYQWLGEGRASFGGEVPLGIFSTILYELSRDQRVTEVTRTSVSRMLQFLDSQGYPEARTCSLLRVVTNGREDVRLMMATVQNYEVVASRVMTGGARLWLKNLLLSRSSPPAEPLVRVRWLTLDNKEGLTGVYAAQSAELPLSAALLWNPRAVTTEIPRRGEWLE